MTEPNRASRRAPRVLYPMLPSILDEDSLSALATLESEELAFVRRQGRSRSQYLHALYLKAMAALGHSHFEPKDLPLQFRQRIAEELHLELDLLRVLSIDRGEKSHIVSAARAFLGLAPLTPEVTQEVLRWLEDGPAKRESDVAILVNAAAERFRELRVEIPSLSALQSAAQQALSRAERAAIEAIESGIGSEAGERLDGLLSGRDGRTPFDFLKDPVPQATVSNLARELLRLERLELLVPKGPFPKAVTRHQLERFARLADRYTAPELAQLSRVRRRALLLCFVRERRTFLLDAVAEMLIRVWENTQHRASEHANVLQRAAASAHESQQGVLSEILSIIKKSRDPVINICDSAGKSNLVFGLSGLLNILLYPRVRSRHLKLWGTREDAGYKNIAASIAGQIRCDRIDKGWQDIAWILSSIEAGTAKPLVILNHVATQPQHPAAQGLEELDKLDRSSYLLRYGKDMELRRFVGPEVCKREHWNKFTGEVQAFGDLIREKTIEDQDEVFWFLTVVQNAIVLWNAVSVVENILRSGLKVISENDLRHILPTMTEHINFVGRFDLDMNRKPPFELKRVVG